MWWVWSGKRFREDRRTGEILQLLHDYTRMRNPTCPNVDGKNSKYSKDISLPIQAYVQK